MQDVTAIGARSTRRRHLGFAAVRARGPVRPLLPTAALRNAFHRPRSLLERVLLVEPLVLERRLGISVAVHLAGVALAPPSHAHALSFPAAAGKRRAIVEIFFIEIVRALLIAADEQ